MAEVQPGPDHSDNSITALLARLSEGNREAEARLIPKIYGKLRRPAGYYMRGERGNHTLQPTALVHEAYARLVHQQLQVPWQSRAHFLTTASQLMRHILVDHARSHRAYKRGGLQRQVTLDDAIPAASGCTIDVIALGEALERLAQFDPRQARVRKLHYLGGLTLEEISSVLDFFLRGIKRDSRMARDWLKGELSK